MDDGYYDDTADTLNTAPTPPAFFLAPLNSAARKAVDHAKNLHLRCTVNDTIGLWLSFADPNKQVCTLGKEDTDIHLPDTRSSSKGSPHISALHASFQVVEETGAVLLWNLSNGGTVEPIPHSSSFTVKFRSNAQSVLVAQGINSRIAFGDNQWYQFEIQWQSDGMYQFPKHEPYSMGPRNSRNKKYVLGGDVGAGSYGTVSWVLDAINGQIIAVKRFHKLSGKNLEFATREVANLFRINKDDSIKHEHILQILDYAGGTKGDDWGEIFMPLMKGNLKTLVEKVTVPDEHALSDTVLRQMLLALECIASHNIIHRDVKPENILWEHDPSSPSPENYRFCLGDFGLSNDPTLACTAAGTEPFMAPEVFHRKRQTAKVDIWSLFATIVWTRTPEFRRACSQMRAPDLHVWLVDFSRTELYANIRRMASMDPVKRPSATKQLALLEAPAQAPFEQDYAGSMHVGSYGSNTSRASGDEAGALGGDLAARFSRGLTLQDNNINTPRLTYGSGSSEAVTSPELPYYEPYASGLMQTYFGAQAAGPSKGYMPPSPDPADAPRDHGAWVMPYENAYAPRDSQNSGSGTAVPDTWTAVAPTVDVEEEAPRRKHKGKNRA